ncbi:MAG TPA: hypothetical protein VHM64_04475 [Candidatus Binatia bacterium]|nr:hypothetical protein [Candidatus Binatia bacterium]
MIVSDTPRGREFQWRDDLARTPPSDYSCGQLVCRLAALRRSEATAVGLGSETEASGEPRSGASESREQDAGGGIPVLDWIMGAP